MLRLMLSVCLIVLSQDALAARLEVVVRLRDHLFHPAKVYVPANKKVKLIIINEDDDPEEFDSFALNREKVVFGQAKANLFIGPLPPGRYPFFGQYHPTTAQGEVIVLPPGEEVPDAH